MHSPIAKTFLLLLALTVAVPESHAKRAGSGRSAGRQSAVVPKRAAPPAAPRAQPAAPPPAPAQAQRAQPVTPPSPPTSAARQALPPNAPERTLPRQASTPWGGLLGGALIGLGLGSLLGSRDRDPNTMNQTEGSSANAGETASGAGDTSANAEQVPTEGNGINPAWWLGILALVVFFLVRRGRRKGR